MLSLEDKKIIEDKFAPFEISKEDMDLLKDSAELSKFEVGQALYKDKHSCYGFFIVKSGILRAFMLSPNAKEITLFNLKSGEECMLCSACTNENLQLEINLEAKETLEIIVISPSVFAMLLQKYQKLTNYSLSLISRHFAQGLAVMQQALFLPLADRIRDFLKENAKEGILNFTHEEIANELGATREAVSRTLKRMEKTHEIELLRGKIVLSHI